MNESLRTPTDSERADVHLKHLVERLVREGRSEVEIEAAVHRAGAGRRRRRRPIARGRRRLQRIL
jgi:hypothetical protein